jgi:hypothetical protein
MIYVFFLINEDLLPGTVHLIQLTDCLFWAFQKIFYTPDQGLRFEIP